MRRFTLIACTLFLFPLVGMGPCVSGGNPDGNGTRSTASCPVHRAFPIEPTPDGYTAEQISETQQFIFKSLQEYKDGLEPDRLLLVTEVVNLLGVITKNEKPIMEKATSLFKAGGYDAGAKNSGTDATDNLVYNLDEFVQKLLVSSGSITRTSGTPPMFEGAQNTGLPNGKLPTDFSPYEAVLLTQVRDGVHLLIQAVKYLHAHPKSWRDFFENGIIEACIPVTNTVLQGWVETRTKGKSELTIIYAMATKPRRFLPPINNAVDVLTHYRGVLLRPFYEDAALGKKKIDQLELQPNYVNNFTLVKSTNWIFDHIRDAYSSVGKKTDWLGSPFAKKRDICRIIHPVQFFDQAIGTCDTL